MKILCFSPGCQNWVGTGDGVRFCGNHRAPSVPDMVNEPPHYKAGGFEAQEVIEAFGLPWHMGDAVAYILRADRKGNAIEDLKKAVCHLRREIEIREARK